MCENMNLLTGAVFFVLVGIVTSIEPAWQKIVQDEGKSMQITWKFRGNETLLACNIYQNNTDVLVTGLYSQGRRERIKLEDRTMVYGTDLSFIVKPFNVSVHGGRYILQANTTNAVQEFSYEVEFELGVKTKEDIEEKREVSDSDIEEARDEGLSLTSILSIVAGSIALCVAIMIGLIYYKSYYMDEQDIAKAKNGKAK